MQDDTSHSGTPLNPQGSREHQLLGSEAPKGSFKNPGNFQKDLWIFLVPKCFDRNALHLENTEFYSHWVKLGK